jgi:hypothetical protein
MQTFCASLKARPLHRVLIRLLAPDGKQLDSRLFEPELGDVAVKHMYGTSKSTYLVTLDYSTGASTYSGQRTMLVEAHGNRLEWLKALDDSTHGTEEIDLATAIKSEWKVVPAKARSGRDILNLFCQPRGLESSADAALIFENHLVRYHFDGDQWRRSEAIWRHGMPDWPIDCWEGEGTFPPRDSFP